MKRYSIFVREFDAGRETELLQVEVGAEGIASELRRKTIAGKHRLPKYVSVRIQDNNEKADA